MLPDDSQPRHRTVAGAAAAGGAEPRTEPSGATRELGSDFRPVHDVPGDWRVPLCAVPGTGPGAPSRTRPSVPFVHLAASPGGRSRTGDGGDFGGSDVEPERRAQRIGVYDGAGFVASAGA